MPTTLFGRMFPPRSGEPGHRVVLVHRFGALLAAAVLAAFALRGISAGLVLLLGAYREERRRAWMRDAR